MNTIGVATVSKLRKGLPDRVRNLFSMGQILPYYPQRYLRIRIRGSLPPRLLARAGLFDRTPHTHQCQFLFHLELFLNINRPPYKCVDRSRPYDV